MVAWAVGDLAKTLGIPRENVRVVSPYIGGGFGGKLFLRSDAILAALGARAVGRPVKIALPRPFMMNNTTHRPATLQRLRLGASKDGKLTAFGHEGWSGDLPGGAPESSVMSSRLLYAAAQSHDDHASRGARSARRQRDARARRRTRLDGFRNRHGRDGGEAEARSHRVSHAQRHAGESREPRAALLAAAADAVFPHRRRKIRLEPPQSQARAGARRRVVSRHRRRHGLP